MGTLNKVVKHIKHGDLFNVVRRNLYIKNHIYKANENKNDYLIGLGKICLKYKMDLENPRTFNEKLNWYKLHYYDPLMSKVVDKIEAKEFVKSKGLEEILVPTISSYNNVNEIDYDELPSRFVIKNTEDSGGVFLCYDKSKHNISEIKDKLTRVDKTYYNGVHFALETAYSKGNNKIIVEDLIKTTSGKAPLDYKFFCFNGEPKFLFVATNRETNVCFDFFDLDFNRLELKNGHPNSKQKINKPKNFDRMLEICKILSKDFPHVRVDLYNEDGKIYFGELTFYHNAGMSRFNPKSYDLEFGKYFDIESIKQTKYYIK